MICRVRWLLSGRLIKYRTWRAVCTCRTLLGHSSVSHFYHWVGRALRVCQSSTQTKFSFRWKQRFEWAARVTVIPTTWWPMHLQSNIDFSTQNRSSSHAVSRRGVLRSVRICTAYLLTYPFSISTQIDLLENIWMITFALINYRYGWLWPLFCSSVSVLSVL